MLTLADSYRLEFLMLVFGFCAILVATIILLPERTVGLPISGDWHPSLLNRKRDEPEPLPSELLEAFRSGLWIWTAESGAPTAPALDRAFRSTFTSPMGKVATSAVVLLSVDDRFSFYVNGHLVGRSPTTPHNWRNATTYSVTLAATSNVFAIRGTNEPGDTGLQTPAGVLAAIQITFSDGITSLLTSDVSWRTTKDIPDGFESLSFDDSRWTPATVLFKYGEGPWLSDIVFPTDAAPIITLPASNAGTTSSIMPVSTTTPTPTPTPTGNDPLGTSLPVGAIVGGVIGSVTLILLVVAVLLWRKERVRRNAAYLGAAAVPVIPFDLGRGDRPYSGSHGPTHQPASNLENMAQHKSSLMSSSAFPPLSVATSTSTQQYNGHTLDLGSRVQLLETLVIELDQEMASGCHNHPRVVQLRGRVAQLTGQINRVDSDVDEERERGPGPPTYYSLNH